MERLTQTTEERVLLGIEYPTYLSPEMCKAYDERLKAYEDTGLMPEEIAEAAREMQEIKKAVDELYSHQKFIKMLEERGVDVNAGLKRMEELVNAEADGRLVVLPCKVGEIVWLIDERFWGRGRERWPLVRCKINEFVLVGEVAFAVLDGAESWYSVSRFKALSVRDFGKTVFLTREEAEAALKGEGNG